MALTDNKAKIQALLAGINALPEAGSGEAPDPVLQEKSITPTKQAQAVTPDTGYDGLSKVNVGAIPAEYIVPSGTVSITENGTHNVREVESVNVNVAAPDPALQEKTVSPSTDVQEVTPDGGYDGLSKVTVNAMPTATQATPSINVSSDGLITASATQDAGYVDAGTKSATEQLPIQAAQTITPGTADQTIQAGQYLAGGQTIKGDANLIPANIAKGVSIFGVTGTMEAGGGDDGTCSVTFSYSSKVACEQIAYNNGSEWVGDTEYKSGVIETLTVAKGSTIAMLYYIVSGGSDVTGIVTTGGVTLAYSEYLTLINVQGDGTCSFE